MAQSSIARGLVFAGLGGVCWGFSGACAQLLTETYGLSIPWLICVRLVAGSVFFLGLACVKDSSRLKQVPKHKNLLLLLAAYGVLGVLMPQVCYLNAIYFTNAGIATVMERVGLVIVLVYTCIHFHRAPRGKEIAGVVLALAGVFLIATGGNIGTLAISPEGLMFGGLLALSLLFYTVLPVKPLAVWGNFITTGLGMLVAGVVAWVAFQPWNIEVNLNGEIIFYIVLMIVAGTICSYGFFMQGIKEAGSMRAGLMGCTEPVAATAFAALWLGTVFTPPIIAGIVLIIAMMPLLTGGEEPKER